jgi:hypothetical protein
MWHDDMHQDGPLRLKYGMMVVCDAPSVATIIDNVRGEIAVAVSG